MPEPFWLELEAAYNAVAANPTLTVSVERGDKTGIVKFIPEQDVIFIKIEQTRNDNTANIGVELNPNAKESE